MQSVNKWRFNELTRSELDLNKEPYTMITAVVQELYKRGMLERFHGECLACADIVQQTLAARGMVSRIVETQLSIISENPKRALMWRFVGFNNPNYAAQGIDTHVVVITETPTPVLIDLSIAGFLDGDRPWVIEPVNVEDDPLVLGRYQIEDFCLTYHPKQDPRLMGLHQQTLLDRMRTQLTLTERVKTLGFWIILALVFSGINTLFNIVILSHRFITGGS